VFDYALSHKVLRLPSWVCENLPLAQQQPRPGRPLDEWPPEELSKIRLVLHRLTALRVDNPEDAEDLVQDTLVTMAQKCSEVALEKGLLIWAMGILRKKIGNYYRKTKRFTPLEEFLASLRASSQRVSIAPCQESRLRHAELRQRVDRVLAGMAPHERIALQLYLEGCPTHEIAALLHPERYQNIVNWLHRGRKKLVREVTRAGFGRQPRRAAGSSARSV